MTAAPPDEQRGRGVPVAQRVEEAVNRGSERAQPEQVQIDEVDPDLDAQDVRGGIPHRTGRERVEQRTPAEAEFDQLDSPPPPARWRWGPEAPEPWLMELPL